YNGSAGIKAFDNIEEEEKKDANDPENEDNEIPSTEEPRVNQEVNDSVNNTNIVNVICSIVNAANNEVNDVGRKSSIELPDDPNMPDLEDISIFEDLNEDVFGAEADLNNMESFFKSVLFQLQEFTRIIPLNKSLEICIQLPKQGES
nr:hypothetical protein [Tanacetum cinerariifolium]